MLLRREQALTAENIRWDFEKLLVGKAAYKIMVFQAKNDLVLEYSRRLKEALKTYQGAKTEERYLLVCWNEDEKEFNFENAVT